MVSLDVPLTFLLKARAFISSIPICTVYSVQTEEGLWLNVGVGRVFCSQGHLVPPRAVVYRRLVF